MCFNLYDYQPKASRYSYGLNFKIRVTTNHKDTMDSQNPKRNFSIIQIIKSQKEKKKGKKKARTTTKSPGKQCLTSQEIRAY